jgi:hypothetical protein
MVKISETKGPVSPVTPEGPAAAGSVPAGAPAKPAMADDGLSQKAKGFLGYKRSPLVSGALKIFGDGVVLPSQLTDPKNPANDLKYLRLLAAVLDLPELERHFFALEGEEQTSYLEHKAQLREARWEKIEKEKEEKRRQKDPGEPPEEDS